MPVRATMSTMLEAAERIYDKEHVGERCEALARLYAEGRDSATTTGIAVNEVYPRTRTAVAAFFGKRPEILSRPHLPEQSMNAVASELMLNYLVRREHMTRDLRECLHHARLFMFGAVRLGTTERERGMKLPSITAMDPRAVRFDPTTDRLRPERMRWFAWKTKRSMAALRASGLYKDKKLDQLVDAHVKRSGEMPLDETAMEVWLWEHYLLETIEGKTGVLVGTVAFQGNDDQLPRDEHVWIREEEFTRVAGLPIRVLQFIPNPHGWYPVAPPEMWLDQLKEVNNYRNNKLAHADRAQRKLWYKGSLDEGEASKLELREPMTWVRIPEGESGEQMFGEIPVWTLDSQIYAGEVEAENTITMIDGIGSGQMGATPQKTGSPSATRDAIVEQYLRLRSSDNQEVWEDFVEDVFDGLLKIAQAHLTGTIWLSVAGKQPVKVDKAAIQGELGVMIGAGSMQPRDRERDKQEADALWQKFVGNPAINQAWLIRLQLQAYGRKDIDEALTALATPVPEPVNTPILSGGGAPGSPAAALQAIGQQNARGNPSPLSMAASFRNVK